MTPRPWKVKQFLSGDGGRTAFHETRTRSYETRAAAIVAASRLCFSGGNGNRVYLYDRGVPQGHYRQINGSVVWTEPHQSAPSRVEAG